MFHLHAVHAIGTAPACQLCGRHDFKSYRTYSRHKNQCHEALLTSRKNRQTAAAAAVQQSAKPADDA